MYQCGGPLVPGLPQDRQHPAANTDHVLVYEGIICQGPQNDVKVKMNPLDNIRVVPSARSTPATSAPPAAQWPTWESATAPCAAPNLSELLGGGRAARRARDGHPSEPQGVRHLRGGRRRLRRRRGHDGARGTLPPAREGAARLRARHSLPCRDGPRRDCVRPRGQGTPQRGGRPVHPPHPNPGRRRLYLHQPLPGRAHHLLRILHRRGKLRPAAREGPARAQAQRCS